MFELGRQAQQYLDEVYREKLVDAAAGTASHPPRERIWPYEYSGTLEDWRRWCQERGDPQTLAEVEDLAALRNNLVDEVCARDDAGIAAVRSSGLHPNDPRRADVWARAFHGRDVPSCAEPCPHPDNPPAISMCRQCGGSGYRRRYG